MTGLLNEIKQLDFSISEFTKKAEIAPQTLARIMDNKPVHPRSIRKVKQALAELKRKQHGLGLSQS